MKRGTPRHWKIDRLMRLLGIRRRDATGLIVMLWDWAGDYAVDGDLSRCLDEAASGADWDGDTAKLFDVLRQCHLVDVTPDGRTVIHDWEEHCEEYIKKRIKRRKESRPVLSDVGCQNLPDQTRPDQTRQDEAATADKREAAAAESEFSIRLEEAGITPGQARIALENHGETGVRCFFGWWEQSKASGKLTKPVAALRSVLKSPEKWGFIRNGSGEWSPPVGDSVESIRDKCKRLFGGAK